MNSLITKNSDINHSKSRYGEGKLVCKRFKRETEDGRTFSVSSKNFGIRFQPVLKTKLKCQIQIQIYENA